MLTRHVTTRISISKALQSALNINGIPVPHVVYPGQDEAQWQAAPDQVYALRQRLGLLDKPVILLAGRLNPHKGSVQLLKALDLVRHHVPDVRLLLLTRSTLEQQGLQSSEFAQLVPHVVTGGWLEGRSLPRLITRQMSLRHHPFILIRLSRLIRKRWSAGSPL